MVIVSHCWCGKGKNRRLIRFLIACAIVAVVVAFFICWAPNHAQRIWAVYLPSPPPLDYPTSFVTLNYLSGILYYINCTVNPILYQFMSRQFRQAFWVSFNTRRGSTLTIMLKLKGRYCLFHRDSSSHEGNMRFDGHQIYILFDGNRHFLAFIRSQNCYCHKVLTEKSRKSCSRLRFPAIASVCPWKFPPSPKGLWISFHKAAKESLWSIWQSPSRSCIRGSRTPTTARSNSRTITNLSLQRIPYPETIASISLWILRWSAVFHRRQQAFLHQFRCNFAGHIPVPRLAFSLC